MVCVCFAFRKVVWKVEDSETRSPTPQPSPRVLIHLFHPIILRLQGIISDLFPGVVLPKADYAAMEAAMQDVCKKQNLQPTDYFLLKAIQL